MSNVYLEIPANYSLISSILISKRTDYLYILMTSNELYFYDTCSIQCHSNSINRNKIINFIKAKGGNIIITQTVLSELGGFGGNIQENVLDYINEIHNAGINIILMKEEDSLYIIRKNSDISYQDCNLLLGMAAVNSKQNKGCIENIIKEFKLANKVFNEHTDSKSIYEGFFKFARTKKESGDSLAEELMFIIFIIFLSMPPIPQIIFFSNDRRSLSSLVSTNTYTKLHYEGRKVYHLTTTTLIYKLYKDGLITSKAEFKELLDSSYSQDNINAYYSDKYSINIEENSFTKTDLIDRVFDESEFTILF